MTFEGEVDEYCQSPISNLQSPISNLLILALLLLSESAIAQFNDQGFVTAKVRTDYNSQTEGLFSNPITYVSPCLFPARPCGNSPTAFSNTLWFKQNVTGYPNGSFWVLDFNNEYSYNVGGNSTFNPGPPNQSVQRSAPGYGLMGFTAIKDIPAGENFYRAHLVANSHFPNPNGHGIPYIAIGAERHRGNNTIAPGVFNTATGRKRVQFVAKLWPLDPPDPGGTPAQVFYVTAIAEWGGKPRGIQLALFHWGKEFSDPTATPPNPTFITYEWNWPMQESFYHPGAQWAFMDAEDVHAFCPTIPAIVALPENTQLTYDINLQSLFKCLSDLNAWDTPMPSSTVYLRGVHWAVEMSGENGGLWASVHDMKMVQ